jgi:hypothetical protein
MGERLAEARRAKAESDTYHVPDDGDGFCEALNPSYDLCFCRHCEERSDEAIHSFFVLRKWIASRSLSSGARSRDPLARNDGGEDG